MEIEGKLGKIKLRYQIGAVTSNPTTAANLYHHWLCGEYDADSLLSRINQGQRQFEVGGNTLTIEVLE